MAAFKDAFVLSPGGDTLRLPGQAIAGLPGTYSSQVTWMGAYRLRLPTGTVLKSIRYYHMGSPGGLTAAALFRSGFGEGFETLAAEDSSDVSGNVVAVPLSWLGSARRIRRGQVYTIVVSLKAPSAVYGVEVEY
jgi:hypothetical protein